MHCHVLVMLLVLSRGSVLLLTDVAVTVVALLQYDLFRLPSVFNSTATFILLYVHCNR
jgi:hypothetical protein